LSVPLGAAPSGGALQNCSFFRWVTPPTWRRIKKCPSDNKCPLDTCAAKAHAPDMHSSTAHNPAAHRGEIARYLAGHVACALCGGSHPASYRECPVTGRCAECGLKGCYSEACAEEIGIQAEFRATYLKGLARFGAFVTGSIRARVIAKSEAA